MANMWIELGYGNNYKIFTQTEITTSIIVLLMMAMLVTVKRNIRALRIIHVLIISGFTVAYISSLMFVNGTIEGPLWMQLTGLGLYMAYIPFNCLFFERLIAVFKTAGNAGFLMYVIDAFGYLGSSVIIVSKEILHIKLNWVSFYSNGVIIFSVIGIAGTVISFLYFNKKYNLYFK